MTVSPSLSPQHVIHLIVYHHTRDKRINYSLPSDHVSCLTGPVYAAMNLQRYCSKIILGNGTRQWPDCSIQPWPGSPGSLWFMLPQTNQPLVRFYYRYLFHKKTRHTPEAAGPENSWSQKVIQSAVDCAKVETGPCWVDDVLLPQRVVYTNTQRTSLSLFLCDLSVMFRPYTGSDFLFR